MNSEKIDILIVDDRPENLLALEAVLDSSELNLVKAFSGEDALKRLLEKDFALILMDVQMPGMDGFETAAYIKQSPRSRNTPIIFITALNKSDKFVHQGYETGAVDYIFKPIDPEILKSKVAVFVKLYKNKLEIQYQAQLLHESDLRERHQALTKLKLKSLLREQAVQQKYRDLVDGITHGIIWTADAKDFVFTFISPSAEKILNQPLDDLYGDGFAEKCLLPEDKSTLFNALSSVRKSKGETRLEHRLIDRNGKIFWFNTGIRFAHNLKTQEDELSGLSIDITPIKAVENELKKSKERAQFVAEASLLLSQSLDSALTLKKMVELVICRTASFFAIEILNEEQPPRRWSAAKNKTGLHFFEEPHLETPPFEAAKLVSQVLHTGEVVIQQELENVSLFTGNPETAAFLEKLGPFSVVIVPLLVRGQTIGCLSFVSPQNEHEYSQADLAMFEDIGRRTAVAVDNAQLYKEACDAIAARDEFLSIVSHELKTPLTPLKLNAQVLIRALGRGTLATMKEEKISQMLGAFDSQMSKLARLIDDLLDISRMNIHRLDLKLQSFSLAELVADIIERFSDELENSQCPLEFTQDSTAFGCWDRMRIEQIVVNLLTNAIKYGSGKPIKISLSQSRSIATLTIQDHGIGIASTDQNRIFDRFERAVSSNHFGGLGLGLYIVKELIGLHSGSIRVESRLGEGSTFTVELPTDLSSSEVPSISAPSPTIATA